jgi:hypothetical protein
MIKILCYALIKIILKENLNTSQREVVSSFHIKHVMFWCVELYSCQWVYSNYIDYTLQNIKTQTKAEFLLTSKRLIHKSLNLDNSCVKLRAATFFLTNLKYSQSIEICDTFLTSPPNHKMRCGYNEYHNDILKKVFHQMFEVNTTEEIDNSMKAISPMF